MKYRGIQLKAGALYKISYVASILILCFMVFVLMMQSPINMWLKNANCDTDCGVFKTIALQMQHGLTPYKDTFDHKGPLLYFINYVSLYINEWSGIWYAEVVFMLCTAFFMWKCVVEVTHNMFAGLFSVFISLTAQYKYFGSNYTEEFAMAFIAIALYIYTAYFCSNKISKSRLIVCGACMGAVLMLRPNMIAVWVTFSVAVLVDALIKRKINDCIKFIIWFGIGVALICMPFLIWLKIRSALREFFNQYIIFNMMYTENDGGLENIIKAMRIFGESNIITASFVGAIVGFLKNKNLFGITYFVFEIVNLAFVSIGGKAWLHYAMPLVPMLAYPFGIMIDVAWKECKNRYSKNILTGAIILTIVFSGMFHCWYEGMNTVMKCYRNRYNTDRVDTIGQVTDYVVKNTKEDDRIIVWGNKDIIYVLTGRMPASKYSYQFPIIDIDEGIEKKFIKDIKKNKPPLIVSYYKDDRIMEYVKKFKYKVTAEFDEGVFILERK